MQKWEYIRVSLEYSNGTKVRSVNGMDLPNWKSGPPYIEYLNTLGEQGWELVSEMSTESVGHNFSWFHLKRLKP